jgi:hypothetical protein
VQPRQFKIAFLQHSRTSTSALVATSTNMDAASASQSAGTDRIANTSQAAGKDRADHGNPLSELNKKNATLGSWLFKVARSDVVEYEFPWQGKQVKKSKLRVVFVTMDEGEYVMGLVKVNRDKASELEPFRTRFSQGAVFRSESISFLTDEKAPYVSARCKLILDLRKAKMTFLIQGFPGMPTKACPHSCIADLLEIKPSGKVHRFDVMGVAEMGEVRVHPVKGVRTAIVDVTLIDGSKTKSGKTSDMSFPVFIPGDAASEPMQQLLSARGRVVSFFALNATMESSKIAFKTSTEYYWELAEGSKAERLQGMSGELQSLPEADRETLNQTFTPNQSRDFTDCDATLSACALLDQLQGQNAVAAQGQVLQVNFGVIEPPEPGASVVTRAGNSLWMKVKTQDPTGTAELWMREKAALELSGYATMDAFVQAHSANEVAFPFLCSFRAHMQQPDLTKTTEDSQSYNGGEGSLVIVEAQEQDMTSHPNKSVEGLWDFVKECSPRTDGIIPASLAQLRQSTHYPLQVEVAGEMRPCEKALVLVCATEKSKQTVVRENVARIVTSNVTDAVGVSGEGATEPQQYTLVTMCPADKTSEVAFAPPKSGNKTQTALCIVTAISAEDTFVLESVSLVNQDDAAHMSKLMSKLRSSSAGVSYGGSSKRPHWDSILTNPAHALKKCRRLQQHPTDKSLD